MSSVSSAIGTRPGLESHSSSLDTHNIYDNETHITSLSIIHPEFDVMKDTLINPASPLCTFVHPQFHCKLLIAHQIPYEHLNDVQSQQALAHHLLNGLCAQTSGMDCCAISGSLSV